MSSLREKMMRLRGSAAPAADTAGPADVLPISGEKSSASHQSAEAEAAPERANEADVERLSSAWDGLNVRIHHTPLGGFLLRETRYPLDYRHGEHRLNEIADVLQGLAQFQLLSEAKSMGATKVDPGLFPMAIVPERMLFLDLETTGLGVGTGNVPFMVGLGFIEEDAYVVQQMLIRHPAEERAMLRYLSEKLPAYSHLVTYNGRTFDWPVLAGRFVLNGLRDFRWEPNHIDLLHPSRSIWRNTLASCKLSRVEEERLGIEREDDVPGSLAPAIYFQFLADGNPQPLLGVFRHNEIDMVSLMALVIRFGHLLGGAMGGRLAYPEGAEEQLRTGLWLERMGQTEEAAALYAKFEAGGKAEPRLMLQLAERDKKYGNWERAVLLWQQVAALMTEHAHPSWEAHIELAMYHEHRSKQPGLALQFTEAALELAHARYEGQRLDAKSRAEIEAIRKRIDRLRAKLAKRSG
ncbi:ribonuclease H-like domain-containing protein [Paenibacillus xanthanilyticus]|uniref:Ribonuclease H-like domain-containing protein n=1 Tax=Paenibacillus xanthanilyticus TaxID=1783531 RepID=A0ABV8K555_9BACL